MKQHYAISLCMPLYVSATTAMPLLKRGNAEVTYNAQAGNTVGSSPTTGAGIGIGVAFGVIALMAICLQFYRRHQRKKRQAWLADLQTPITYYQPNADRSTAFTAVTTYEPSLSDEMPIRAGDSVRVHGYYDEEWAYGQNETLAVQGIFPRSCVQSSPIDTKAPVYRDIASPPMAATRNEKALPTKPTI
ncbi:hypothetical protein Unana1_08190 [Umbelopsis nana]